MKNEDGRDSIGVMTAEVGTGLCFRDRFINQDGDMERSGRCRTSFQTWKVCVG